jgi:hypothetical protein
LTLSHDLIQCHPATIAILITAYPEDVVPWEARAAGVSRVLPKPLDVPRLLGGIKQMLAI